MSDVREDNAAPQSPQEQGDLLLLDALLTRVHSSAPASDEARIQRVLASLQANATPIARTQSRRDPRWTWALTAAASLLLAVGLGTYWLRKDAQAASVTLAQVIAVAEAPEERAYQITFTSNLAEQSYRAQLWVRGGRKFVLQHPGPLGEIMAGSDGHQVWLTPAVGPVVVDDDPQTLDRWLGSRGLDQGILHLSTLLSRARERYDFTTLPAESLPDQPGRFARLQGKRSQGLLGPETIDLWVQPGSNVIHRATLAWRETALRPWRSITFDLQFQPRTDDDWFDHRRHHAADRPLIHAQDADLSLEEMP